MRVAMQRRDVVTLVAVIAISVIVLWLGLALLIQEPSEYCFSHEIGLALWSALACLAGTFIGAAALAALEAPIAAYVVLTLSLTAATAFGFMATLELDGVCGDRSSAGGDIHVGTIALLLCLIALVPGWIVGWTVRWVAHRVARPGGASRR